MTGARTAADLRREFDEGFARPIEYAEARVDLLVLRTGDRELAVRTDDIAGVLRCPVVTPLPSRNSALSGVAGVRGLVVAVHDTAVLLGLRQTPSTSGLLACCRDRTVALLFDALVGHGSARADAIGELVVIDGVEHMVLDIAALLQRVRDAASDEG